jgi:hypothetical protein
MFYCRSKLSSCLVDPPTKRAVNCFFANTILLLITSAKLNECFLAGSYENFTNKSTISVLQDQVLKYPLFVAKNVNLNVSRMGLMHLHADLARLLKSFNIPLSQKLLHFRDLEDIIKLVFLLYENYFYSTLINHRRLQHSM